MFLYLITNLVNRKQYVGITKNVEKRKKEHLLYGQGSLIVYAAVQKYGIENFQFTVLYEGSEKEIKKLEPKVIKTLETLAPAGYNLTDNEQGVGRPAGWHMSSEQKKKISIAQKNLPDSIKQKRIAATKAACIGKPLSAQWRQKISKSMQGRKLTSVTKQKMSQTHSLNPPHARGVLFKGVKYPSIQKAAEANNINSSSLRAYFSKWNKTNTWPFDCKYLD
jgi:group I intron endonuclease